MTPDHARHLASLLLLAGTLGGSAATAQTLRDPTLPPTLAPGHGAGPASDAAREPAALALIRGPDGAYRVLHEGRFLKVGQRMGEARITRITETEVWLQTDGDTRKMVRYPAVTIRRTMPRDSQLAPPPIHMPKIGHAPP